MLLGLRHDRFEDEKASPRLDFNKTLPTVAVTWQPTTELMLYASYVESFQANSGTRLVGDQPAAPSEGQQVEAGIKKSWYDGALHTTVAVYDLKLTNVPTPHPSHPGYAILTGEQRVKGIEFEANGQLTENLGLMAQLSFMDPEITEDNAANVEPGNRIAYSVERTGSVWARYDIAAVPELWVAAGLRYQSAMCLGNDNRWELPGYTTGELAAGYTFPGGIGLQANIKNVTDERHYLSGTNNAAGFTSVTPGKPRTLLVSATFPF